MLIGTYRFPMRVIAPANMANWWLFSWEWRISAIPNCENHMIFKTFNSTGHKPLVTHNTVVTHGGKLPSHFPLTVRDFSGANRVGGKANTSEMAVFTPIWDESHGYPATGRQQFSAASNWRLLFSTRPDLVVEGCILAAAAGSLSSRTFRVGIWKRTFGTLWLQTLCGSGWKCVRLVTGGVSGFWVACRLKNATVWYRRILECRLWVAKSSFFPSVTVP